MNPLPSNRNTTPGSVLYSILISIARVIAPFIIVLNNIRKNLLRIYRRQKWQVSHLGLFPAALVYMEIMLRLFTKTGLFKSLIYPLLYACVTATTVAIAGTEFWIDFFVMPLVLACGYDVVMLLVCWVLYDFVVSA